MNGDYAEIGIIAIMPTRGLCRLSSLADQYSGGSLAFSTLKVGIIRGSPGRQATGCPAGSDRA